MRLARIIELVAGALTVISGVAIMLPIWLGGFIAPQSVVADLLAYGMLLLLVVLGVTLDVLAPTIAVKIVALVMLTLGALALMGWFAISFIVTFGLPALLAIIATALAYIRFFGSRVATQPAR